MTSYSRHDYPAPPSGRLAGSPCVSSGAFSIDAGLRDSDKAQDCGNKSQSVHVRLRSLLIAAGAATCGNSVLSCARKAKAVESAKA